jgi:hypothetical protein
MALYSENPNYSYNIVRDLNKVQGVTHVTDLVNAPPRSINYRYISIQNSSMRPIKVALTTYFSGRLPKAQMYFEPGQIINLNVNSIGQMMQYIHILDPINGNRVGYPYAIRTDANTFVLRDGENMWWVDPFRHGSIAAQH